MNINKRKSDKLLLCRCLFFVDNYADKAFAYSIINLSHHMRDRMVHAFAVATVIHGYHEFS